eukprot:6121622-Lingulodinium_polyedra.AAC.1
MAIEEVRLAAEEAAKKRYPRAAAAAAAMYPTVEQPPQGQRPSQARQPAIAAKRAPRGPAKGTVVAAMPQGVTPSPGTVAAAKLR